ncbi:MAG: hypothetical protein ACM3U0_00285 [archaeon]
MHKVTFYPIGNADCSFIELQSGENLLFDYAHCKSFEDEKDLRVDLKVIISDKMEDKKRDYFDIVAFTHADDDHIRGFSDMFFLEHAKKYQGEGRLKINELWVPAAVICEKNLTEEAKILQAESRYRLKNKKRIRVFSRPQPLKDWFESEGLKMEDFTGMFIDAGQIVPNFELKRDNFEIFVHSPFAKREDKELIDRNTGSIVVQCVFQVNGSLTRLILGADTPWNNWVDIVNITKYHKRPERLNWDIIKLPHHCSYLSLSEEKGKDTTVPAKEVAWFYEQGNSACKIVSPSDVIPKTDTDQPPHRQAANYYKDVAKTLKGEFLVTMEFPKESKPEPLEIEIDDDGATTKKRNLGAAGVVSYKAGGRNG